MKKNILFLVFIIVTQVQAQSDITDELRFRGSWILKNGWFDKDVIELERLDSSRHKSYGTQFSFGYEAKKGVYNVFDKKFSVNVYNPERLGLCGNGLLYTDSGEWNILADELTIEIKGGYMLESEFHYIIIYSAQCIQNNKLILTRKSIKKAEIKH